MENNEPIIQQKESIKLMKMSKGYNWEIRVIDDDIEKQMERLERIDKELKARYNQED